MKQQPRKFSSREIPRSEFKSFLNRLAASVSSKRVFLSALAALFFLAPGLARAQAPVTDDTYSQRGREWTNGGAPLVVVQSPNVNGYLRFNLSVFPPNLQSGDIEKATLKLFVNSVQGAGTMYVCRLEANQPWDEKNFARLRTELRSRHRSDSCADDQGHDFELRGDRCDADRAILVSKSRHE